TGAEGSHHQPTRRIRGVRLRMTCVTESHQPVKVEIGAPQGSLAHVMNFKPGPDSTGLAAASIPRQHRLANSVPLSERGRCPTSSAGPAPEHALAGGLA